MLEISEGSSVGIPPDKNDEERKDLLVREVNGLWIEFCEELLSLRG
jgi:hypothetical protein